MRVFAIGDVHLPGGPRAKAMDRFGEIWRDHTSVIARNWNERATDDDVLLIAGDLSWAMTLDEAKDDLAWISALRGTKVLIRGNHDFWWRSIGRVRAALPPRVHALAHDALTLDSSAGGVTIVGTRGWQCPGEVGSADAMNEPGEAEAGGTTYTEHDRAIYEREVGRLRLGLEAAAKAGRAQRLVVMLHYPPMNAAHEPSGFTELLDQHRADACVHGHLHGPASIATAFEGVRGTTAYHCVSADAVKMRPRQIVDDDGRVARPEEEPA